MPKDSPIAADGDEDTTSSTMTRWKYVGTFLASVMIVSLPIIIGGAAFGAFTLSTIGQAWFILYATVTLMAATWAFGKETLESVREFKKGGPSEQR